MTHRLKFSDFCSDDSGAVTTDWLVLTAATFFLGAAVVWYVGEGALTVGSRTDAALATGSITGMDELESNTSSTEGFTRAPE